MITERDIVALALKKIEEDKLRVAVVGTTNGCFHILHAGHIQYLRDCCEIVNFLVIGVNSDDYIRRVKGNRQPIITQEHRMSTLSALCDNLSADTFIVPMNEDDPTAMITAIRPQYHFKGDEYEGKNIPELEVLKLTGGEMLYISHKHNISTTELLNGS